MRTSSSSCFITSVFLVNGEQQKLSYKFDLLRLDPQTREYKLLGSKLADLMGRAVDMNDIFILTARRSTPVCLWGSPALIKIFKVV